MTRNVILKVTELDQPVRRNRVYVAYSEVDPSSVIGRNEWRK